MIISSSEQEVAVGKEMKKMATVAAWQALAVKIEVSCKRLGYFIFTAKIKQYKSIYKITI